MYQNKTKKNNSGFAHHALLGVLVVAVVSLIGVRTLVASHAQTLTKTQKLTNVSSSTVDVTSTGTDTSAGSGALQPASTNIVLPSCGHLQLIDLLGQQYGDNPYITAHIDATQHLRDGLSINEYAADFRIRNNATGWKTSAYEKEPILAHRRYQKMHLRFHVPVWVAEVNPNFKWDLEFTGYKGPFRKCRSGIAGQAQVTWTTTGIKVH